MLRKHLGSRFKGGLTPSPLARDRYSDCITPVSAKQADYIEQIHQAQIGVVSGGLHGSVPWKLAEYLAASRCIVSEPLGAELPQPFRTGTNAVWFNDPDECLDQVERILSNPRDAREMQRANQKYYRDFVRPGALLLNTLRVAFGRADAAKQS